MKLSAGCDEGVVNLAREGVAACVAIGLGLPVSAPLFVRVSPDTVQGAPTKEISRKLAESVPVGFGSTSCEHFSVWTPDHEMTDVMRQRAAAILLFDAIVQNPDRRVGNPNCLVKGDEFRIIDHELAFAHRLIIGWKRPWEKGGMEHLEASGRHILVGVLRGKRIDFDQIRASWAGLSEAGLQVYKATMPPEWSDAQDDVDAALQLVADARDNIDGCIRELELLLS